MFELRSLTVAALRTGHAQTQIDRWLETIPTAEPCAVVVEGEWASLQVPDKVPLRQFSAGCVCCAGQLVLKVQLTGLLRQARPQHVLLLLTQTAHLAQFFVQLRGGLLGFRAIELRQIDQTWP